MVGYDVNDSMTQKQKFLVGCLSGVTTKLIAQPMDVIKIRSQLLGKPKDRFATYRVARRILLEEGFTAFYQGHFLGQVQSIFGISSQFYVYEVTTKLGANLIPLSLKPIESFICGLVAGCVCTTLIIPLDVIRVRQMLVADQYRNFFHAAKTVYRYGGFFAFYAGLGASLLQMGPQAGIQFASFSVMQPLILSVLPPCPPEECTGGNKHRVGNLVIASSLAGAFAGFISKTVTYPLDLAKRRLQISTHRTSKKYKTPSQARSLIRCSNLIDCLKKSYKKEGFRGLFRGWAVTAYKSQLTSVVAFTSYELFCYLIREIYPE